MNVPTLNGTKNINGNVLVGWGFAALMGSGLIGSTLVYAVRATADEVFDSMLKSRGITGQSFQDLQSDVNDLKSDVGSMKTSLNGINNTLTINGVRAETADDDRQELKRKVNKILNRLICQGANNDPDCN